MFNLNLRCVFSEYRREWSDFCRIFTDARIWMLLAWVDIRSKYRRSTLGSLWITAAMAVLAVSIGGLYGQFFGQNMAVYLPYFATGFIVWTFISSCLLEGSGALISYASLVKASQLPLAFHVLRVVQKHLIILGHNAIVLIGVWLYFRWEIGIEGFLSFVGLLFTYVFVASASVVLAIACCRFRDIPPLVQSVVQFLFFSTPIIWDPLSLKFGTWLLWLNPITPFVIASRDPFIGRAVPVEVWLATFLYTGGMLLTAALVYARYRKRVAFWV